MTGAGHSCVLEVSRVLASDVFMPCSRRPGHQSSMPGRGIRRTAAGTFRCLVTRGHFGSGVVAREGVLGVGEQFGADCSEGVADDRSFGRVSLGECCQKAFSFVEGDVRG